MSNRWQIFWWVVLLAGILAVVVISNWAYYLHFIPFLAHKGCS